MNQFLTTNTIQKGKGSNLLIQKEAQQISLPIPNNELKLQIIEHF